MSERAIASAHDVAGLLEEIKLRVDLIDVELRRRDRSGETVTLTSFAQRLYKHRRMRDRFLNPDLFRDPAWDMLLDLYITRDVERRVTVSSACLAAAVPPTTALRWLQKLDEYGLVRRYRDDGRDRRLVFVELTDEAFDRITDLLDRMLRTA